MSGKLVNEVLRTAPKLTPAQLLVAVILAEQARDETRLAYPGFDRLVEWSQLKPSTLREVLTKLDEAGVVERVPVGTDRNGNPQYARRGQQSSYRILRRGPHAGARAVAAGADRRQHTSAYVDEKGADVPAPNGAVRRQPDRRKAPVSPELGAGVPAPYPSGPLREPSSAREPVGDRRVVIDALRERTGKTVNDDHAGAVVRQLLAAAAGEVRDTTRYLRAAIANDSNPSRFLPTPTPPPYVRLPDPPARTEDR